MPARASIRPSPLGVRRILAAVALLLASAVSRSNAQVDSGWGSDAPLCPSVVRMYAAHNGEQFGGNGFKEYETFFWGRYNFIAHNQGGIGPIEMAGFFYVSKAQCYAQGNRGVYVVVSPVIEYYGPRRDGLGEEECTGGGDTELVENVRAPGYDPFEQEVEGGGCGGGGGPTGGTTENCPMEWVVVEKSDDGGNTWYTIYEGWVTVCE
jgi:hypothetical protein